MYKWPQHPSIKIILVFTGLIVALWLAKISTPGPQYELPLEAPEGITRFAVIGDFGIQRYGARLVSQQVKRWSPEFIITTGDNNYPRGRAYSIDANIGQYYHDYIYPYKGRYGRGADKNRFFPCLGNHDYDTFRALPYIDYFLLPGNERYYDFTWGPCHFFAVDSNRDGPGGVAPDSSQALWLKSALRRSKAQWKIVYFHHPPFSTYTYKSKNYMRWPFKDWGASVVFSGNSHNYERILRKGMLYFVNGLGGAEIYKFKDRKDVHGSQFKYDKTNGIMIVDADDTCITYNFININNKIIDQHQVCSSDKT